MNNSMEELYQELLRDHHKHPRFYGEIAEPSSSCLVHNPLCGDRVQVQLVAKVDTDKQGLIEKISFTGKGCSISQASASMMAQQVSGKSIALSNELIALFRRMMKEDVSAEDLERLGDASALQGVRKFAARIRCAQLPWEALDQALKKL